MIISLVHRALVAAGIPIDGVSLGVPETDRAQWSVQFLPAATAPQRTQAATILATVVIDAAAQTATDQESARLQVDSVPLLEKAIVLALIDQLNVLRTALRGLGVAGLPDITPAQAIAAIRAKAGTL